MRLHSQSKRHHNICDLNKPVRFEASAVTSRCTFPWPTGGGGSVLRARKRGQKGLEKDDARAHTHTYTQRHLCMQNIQSTYLENLQNLSAANAPRRCRMCGERLSLLPFLSRVASLQTRELPLREFGAQKNVSQDVYIRIIRTHLKDYTTNTRELVAPRRATVANVPCA